MRVTRMPSRPGRHIVSHRPLPRRHPSRHPSRHSDAVVRVSAMADSDAPIRCRGPRPMIDATAWGGGRAALACGAASIGLTHGSPGRAGVWVAWKSEPPRPVPSAGLSLAWLRDRIEPERGPCASAGTDPLGPRGGEGGLIETWGHRRWGQVGTRTRWC